MALPARREVSPVQAVREGEGEELLAHEVHLVPEEFRVLPEGEDELWVECARLTHSYSACLKVCHNFQVPGARRHTRLSAEMKGARDENFGMPSLSHIQAQTFL